MSEEYTDRQSYNARMPVNYQPGVSWSIFASDCTVWSVWSSDKYDPVMTDRRTKIRWAEPRDGMPFASHPGWDIFHAIKPLKQSQRWSGQCRYLQSNLSLLAVADWLVLPIADCEVKILLGSGGQAGWLTGTMKCNCRNSLRMLIISDLTTRLWSITRWQG